MDCQQTCRTTNGPGLWRTERFASGSDARFLVLELGQLQVKWDGWSP